MTDSPTLTIAPASPQTHRGMTVFPLISFESVELPYQLPEEAINAGTLTIEEVSDQGSVPELNALNTGDTDVLVLDGAQLIGAKQNRMASRSFILPAGSKTGIPVSCIEQGRWRFNKRTFHGSPQHSPSKTRKSVRRYEGVLAAEGVEASAKKLRNVQGQVWQGVGEYQEKLALHSATSSLSDVYDGARQRIDEWVEAFPFVDSQVGVLIFRDDTVLGLDVIGGHEIYRRLHEQLLRGYALDALEHVMETEAKKAASLEGAAETDLRIPDEADALRFLAEVAGAKRTPSPTVGKGAYAVLTGGVVGAELVDGSALAHRNAFAE